jgi:NADH-quinone oxidoreductase subunit J
VSAEQMLFYAFGGLALLSALGVLVNVRNTVNAALCLMVSMLAIAGLFVLLHAEFLGVLQVLVYAGAIVVLFVFVIMLLNLRGGIQGPETHFAAKVLGGVLLTGVAVKFIAVLASARKPLPEVERAFGTVESVGRVLFTDYVLAVEVAGVLLLAGIVAAVILAKRELD